MRTLCSLFAAAALSTAVVTVSRHSSLAMFKASRVAARQWNIYLSGEIHSPWRSNLVSMMQERGLPVTLTGPNDSHADSDDAGAMILGMEEQRKNWDRVGAKVNKIRTQTLLSEADIVVVKFGEKYRQWNAAFDAGYASALNKHVITIHPPEISHMLKEVNADALAVQDSLFFSCSRQQGQGRVSRMATDQKIHSARNPPPEIKWSNRAKVLRF